MSEPQNELRELDQLAYEAYKADCDAQGMYVTTQWNELNALTQKRYRAIAHQVRGHFTGGWMSAPQLEKSLIVELAIAGVEIKRHEGDATSETRYTWRVNELDLEGTSEIFEFALRDAMSALIQELKGEYHYPEQQGTSHLLREEE